MVSVSLIVEACVQRVKSRNVIGVEFLIHSIISLVQHLWDTGATHTDNVTQVPSCCQRQRRNAQSRTRCRSNAHMVLVKNNFFLLNRNNSFNLQDTINN